jgi:hypothetical protein
MTQIRSNKRVLVWLLTGMFAFIFSAMTVQARAEGLAGAWFLEKYQLEGEDLPASGIMIFTEDHFAMVYSMIYQGRSGRGHGGTYTTDGDQVSFVIPWWPQHVAGKSEVMKDEMTAGARFEQEGDSLVLQFDGGSEQRFTRASAGDNASVSQSWLMTDYTSRAKTGPTSGMMLFSGDHFALLYTMRPAGKALDGRAHAGRYARDGSALELTVNWSLEVIDGEGSVDEGSSTRSATVQATDQTLSMDLGGGAVQTFRRAPDTKR